MLIMLYLASPVQHRTQVSEVILEREMYKYKQVHPNATNAEIINRVARYKVPASVVGSPQWHAHCLADLIAMVQKWGMPHFFLTLTAGDREHNGSQWQEVGCHVGGRVCVRRVRVMGYMNVLCLACSTACVAEMHCNA